LLSSLAALLHVSLRRSRAAWPIVAAAALICVLATSLMAAGPMYADAVSIAGLRRVLADAPVPDANIQVTLRTEPVAREAIDAALTEELARALGAPGGTLERYGRSDTFEVPDGPTEGLVDLVQIAFAEGLDEHATLVDGAWPVALGGSGPVPVAIVDAVATRLGWSVGDTRVLPSRIHREFSVPIRIDGIFRIDDPADPFWWEERQVLEGLVTSERFAAHGPVFTTPEAFLARTTAGRTELGWRAFPDRDALRLADIGPLRARVGQLDARLEAATDGTPVTVQTRLPEIVADAERSLLASRTGVLLLTAQFVVLAAYAVLLSAALLVEHRRTDTAMLRSRGAGPARIAVLSLAEGLLLTVPAALLGPWIAGAGLRALNVAGPLADIELRIDPVVSADGFVAAGLAAAVCLVALLVPAFPRIRSFAAIHGSVGRAETRTAGHRFGLDIALLLIAGIGLWQLRHYGAPLTRSVQGTLGIDPLLVATPALGVLAGAVLALRIVPLTAAVIERGLARRRGLVPALGARQLSRRPLRYTRAALLLMLAMSMGVFAITYTRTWSDSQRDQATFQVGADVRAEPGRRASDLPVWALERAYDDVPGIATRTAVHRAPMRVPRSDASGQLVAVDAATAASVLRIRPDLVDAPLDELLAPLVAARAELPATTLPGEPRRLQVGIDLSIEALQGPREDPDSGAIVIDVADPAALDGARALTASVVVRDATGQAYRFGGAAEALGEGPYAIEVPLGDAAREENAAFAYPLDLVGVEVRLHLPPMYELTQGRVAVTEVQASPGEGPEEGGWARVDLARDQGWRLTAAVHGLPHRRIGERVTGRVLTVEVPTEGLPTIQGVDAFERGTVLVFAPTELDRVAAEPIPVIATDRFLDATARAVGDTVPIDIGGVDRDVRISAAVRAFPTVDPDTPALIIDLPTVGLLRYEGSGAADPPDEWWFALADGAEPSVVDTLRAPAIGSASVVSLEGRARSLATDPVALGVIGALAIGVAAAATFAIVGFVASAAVAARERVTEFALLRALGLSSGQLSGWLSLENATLALISLIAGSGLGLAVSWVALPFVTVSRTPDAAFPPIDVAIPWGTLAILEALGLVGLALAVVGLTWSLGRVGMASSLRIGED
jgi:hypothetical protein